jgi:ribonuclease-3
LNYIQNIFNARQNKNNPLFSALEPILGFRPKTVEFYERAFTHRSTKLKDSQGNAFNYERLEYVGDAILGAVIADYLYKSVPGANEGYLTKMRSKIVSRGYLNKIGKEMGLMPLMRSNLALSKFGQNTHGNLLEALVGAVFLDKGFKSCKQFIYKGIIDPYVDISLLEGKITSYKSLLVNGVKKKKTPYGLTAKRTMGLRFLSIFL